MKKIDVNGITLRYTVAGSGPWVTLSHALACDMTMWDELAAALAPRFTVLRYDTRGHGGSSAPAGDYSFGQLVGDVTGLLDHLKVERTHFVGLSMGGMIAQHFALTHPGRLDRLVIASSSSCIPAAAGPVWDERIALARELGMGALVEQTLGRWFTPGFRAARRDILARIGTLVGATPVTGYAGCGAAIRSLDVTAQLASLRNPTLVLVGRDDPGTPPAMSEIIAAAIPGARLEVLDAASHLLNIEQAAAFNTRVADFLGQPLP